MRVGTSGVRNVGVVHLTILYSHTLITRIAATVPIHGFTTHQTGIAQTEEESRQSSVCSSDSIHGESVLSVCDSV